MIKGLRMALVQALLYNDKKKNIATVVKEIHKAKANGAQLVVLPACFNVPFSKDYLKSAESVPNGESCLAISKAAAEANVCVVGGSLIEKCNDKFYNTCTVWNKNGDLIMKYRKIHMTRINMPGKLKLNEFQFLASGDEITSFELDGIKIGVGLCYDLRFPDLATAIADKGCSLLLYPSSFNMVTGPTHWELLGRSRANDQQMWVALVSPARNIEAEYVTWGHSMVIDPWGQVVAAVDEKPQTLYTNIDIGEVEKARNQIKIGNEKILKI